MKVKDIIQELEKAAPPALQESFDNAGLCTGNPDLDISSALVTVDVTEEVIDEAIGRKAHLIVAHHPLIFQGLKKITGASIAERCVIKAIQNNIAIYCVHTNLDNVVNGVNTALAGKLNLKKQRFLSPARQQLCKLVTFVPSAHAQTVREALFGAGAGHIGNYDSCSFNLQGEGTFRGSEGTKPFVGEPGKHHTEPETRIETIFPKYLQTKILSALKGVHPYEEPAVDLYLLENANPLAGSGMIGELEKPVTEKEFMTMIKTALNAGNIRHSPLTSRTIQRVAVCGGSGSFLIHDALKAGADAFVTGDIKYHQFSEPEGRMLLIDAGHYETEQFTKNIFYEIIRKKFPTFAVHFSEVRTNPINYF